jgi:HrpA-like RNA helicase
LHIFYLKIEKRQLSVNPIKKILVTYAKKNSVSVFLLKKHLHSRTLALMQSASPQVAKTCVRLPLIYNGDMMDRFMQFLQTASILMCVLTAPTGYGKTVGISRTCARYVKELRAQGRKTKCTVLMPYRISVKEAYDHSTRLSSVFDNSELSYSFAMGGGTSQGDSNSHVSFQTTGYAIEKLLNQDYTNSDVTEILVLDEVHDATWQTEFARNFLIHLAKTYPNNIKIVFASATVDIDSILSVGNDLPHSVISMEQVKPNVNFHFHSGQQEAFNKNGVIDTKILCQSMMAMLNDIISNTPTGHILVLMPGENEIMTFLELVTKNVAISSKFALFPLHSLLSQEEMHIALHYKDRKIVVATTIIENAITIDNLTATLDCCLRKVMYIDENGVKELKIVTASRSNIIQLAGRCGRQGETGHANVMMSEDEFAYLRHSAPSESEYNPVYNQLIKCVKHKLPYEEILRHTPPSKITKNQNVLCDIGALELTASGSLSVTDFGDKIMSLPCNLRTAKFVLLMCEELVKNPTQHNFNMFYQVLVIAAWIEKTPDPLHTPNFFGKSWEETDALRTRVEESHNSFMRPGDDDLQVFVRIWNECNAQPNWKAWCKEHYIREKIIDEVFRFIRDIARALERIFPLRFPDTFLKASENSADTFRQVLPLAKKHLLQVFKMNLFVFRGITRTGDRIYARKLVVHTPDSYLLDKFNKNKWMLTASNEHVLAFGLKKITGQHNRVYLRCLMQLEDAIPSE